MSAIISVILVIPILSSISNGNNIDYMNNDTISQEHEEKLLKWRTQLNEISDSSLSSFSSYCTCDLNVHYCDVDCCCDSDCGQMNKYAFTECIAGANEDYYNQQYRDEPQYNCHSSANGFGGRKKFPSSNRLLCITLDNAARSQSFVNRKAITESGQLMSIKKMVPTIFKWSDKNIHSTNYIMSSIWFHNESTMFDQESLKSTLEYKSGNSIVRSFVSFDHNTTTVDGNVTNYWHEYWRLPSTLNSKLHQCNHMHLVPYIRPFNSSCVRMLRNIANSCTKDKFIDSEHYYRAIHFHYYNVLNETYRMVPIELDRNYTRPRFESKNGICMNIVEQADYTIWNEGIFGITRVQLRLHQINLDASSKMINQKFSVRFVWKNSSQPESRLSGNPGYIHGKQILFAKRTKNETVPLIPYKSVYLIEHDHVGFCMAPNKVVQNQILFGINRFRSCRLQSQMIVAKAKLCTTLRTHITQYLGDSFSNLSIASFANVTTLNHTEQWIPILPVDTSDMNSSECTNVTRALSIVIYYIRVGNERLPQNKIIGATISHYPLNHESMITTCTNQNCTITLDTELATSVDFVDVSSPIRSDYAPPPSIKIELPNDFFYPFQTSGTGYLSISYSLVPIHFIVFTTTLTLATKSTTIY